MQEASDNRRGRSEKVLVLPYDIRIPKIRISTRQAEELRSHRCVYNVRVHVCAPSLFSHCGTICVYSDWTPWGTVQQRIPTTKSLCASRRYYVQQRTRQIVSVIGDRADCNEVNQTQKICKLLLCSYRKECIVTSTCEHAPNVIVSNPSIVCNI